MNCIDAISMGDAREVWIIDLNWEIKSYGDKFCLTEDWQVQDKHSEGDEKLPM